MSNSWLASGRDSDGRAFVGPLLNDGDTECLGCLGRRLASCGAQLDRLVPGEAAGPLAALLIDKAAQTDTNGATRLYRFPPMPFCHCARMVRFADADLGLARAVSPLFGPVRHVSTQETPNGGTLAIAHGARLGGSAGLPALTVGSATAMTTSEAIEAATAEALERYAAAFWDPAMGRRPQAVEGKNCDTGAVVQVPASLVFMPYDTDTRPDAAGLAAGRTRADALANALAESVERHVARSVLVDAAPPATSPRRGEFRNVTEICLGRQSGLEVWMSWQARDSPPWHVIGLGSAPSEAAALDKARRERQHVLAHMLRLGGTALSPDVPLGWLDALVFELAEHRRSGDVLRAVCRRSACQTNRPPVLRAEVNLTSPEIAAYGLTVIRVVILAVKDVQPRGNPSETKVI